MVKKQNREWSKNKIGDNTLKKIKKELKFGIKLVQIDIFSNISGAYLYWHEL